MFSALASVAATGLSAESTGDPAGDVINVLLTWGPGGVVVALLLLGWLVPKRQLTQVLEDRTAAIAAAGAERDRAIAVVTAERDRALMAYETERSAHTVTREALTRAENRADVALDSARTATLLLESLGHLPNGPREQIGT